MKPVALGNRTVASGTGLPFALALRDVWNFGDTYQVGVIEGAMQSFLIEGTVEARLLGRPCDVDLLLHWG